MDAAAALSSEGGRAAVSVLKDAIREFVRQWARARSAERNGLRAPAVAGAVRVAIAPRTRVFAPCARATAKHRPAELTVLEREL